MKKGKNSLLTAYIEYNSSEVLRPPSHQEHKKEGHRVQPLRICFYVAVRRRFREPFGADSFGTSRLTEALVDFFPGFRNGATVSSSGIPFSSIAKIASHSSGLTGCIAEYDFVPFEEENQHSLGLRVDLV